MATKQKHPELKVAFDTNTLYTGSASDLVNSSTAKLIADYSNCSGCHCHMVLATNSRLGARIPNDKSWT